MEFLAAVLRIINTINKGNILQKSQNSKYSLCTYHFVGKRLAVSKQAAYGGPIICVSLQKCAFL